MKLSVVKSVSIAALSFFCHAHATLSYADLYPHNRLDTPWQVTQSTQLDGNYRRIKLAGPIVIATGVTLTLRNCVLENVTTQNIIFSSTNSTLILDNSVLLLSDDYVFSQGVIRIKNIGEIRGEHTWHHTSQQQLIIEKDSTLLCTQNCLYYYRPTNENQHGIVFANRHAMLALHNAHIRTGAGGILLTRGILSIRGQCTAHADNTNPAFGILLGTGARVKDNVQFVFATPHSRLRISQPHLRERTCAPRRIWRVMTWLGITGIGIGLGML
mgnify:CR=1 FL=1